MRTLSGMRPCFLAGTLGQGGAERQLYYLLRTLRESGATPRLLTLTRHEYWEEKIEALGVPVSHVGHVSSRWKRLVVVWKQLRTHRPDVLQSQHFFTNAYVGVASRLLGLNGIGALRNDGASEVKACGRVGGRLNLHSPRLLAANSGQAIRFAESRGIARSRLFLLPNVVDTEYFEPAAAPAVGPVTLLAVGRLVKQKRLDRFIELVGRLRNEFKIEVRGVIAGSGRPSEDLQSRLERQARSLGMSPEVLCFRGSLFDVRPVYQEASACILTSDHEGTPNVLLEAMASGLPVVATRVGGVPEIVRQGQTGFLREPDDFEGMVADAVQLVTNARLRSEIGRRARAFVEEHHNLQRLPAYLSGLYRLAQGTRRGRRAPFTPAHSPSDRETASCVGRT